MSCWRALSDAVIMLRGELSRGSNAAGNLCGWAHGYVHQRCSNRLPVATLLAVDEAGCVLFVQTDNARTGGVPVRGF